MCKKIGANPALPDRTSSSINKLRVQLKIKSFPDFNFL
ncbi:hypothetical protein LEP1GSC151_5224 [Leptospira interrogans serovar Grippotyphosa str. LT2186]|uniref:Uncharacterized protein n=2 Tax=Leptospira interrogans TaxID=173 RepID=M3FTB9_LEPIR|nr:hypothetical protein LEP1GSC080_3452 [Leptospira interrogans str. FPW2026]EKO26925.1 hypothetical protein LEP1GSC104_1132 [Leptospira interrogans str. UI 12621]EKR27883.1 hypothetical protein LEP1GSC087_0559 [Leptospira interrogans serovar Bataviae str. L1111]EKR43271.1 hypothetical protein LEP1GSC097_0735 [Leptospira interrogans serovar Grippotyphosa str. UI 08368]EMG10654.1 hypothetical protein LEP1GSC151_5224 [Leptospira interrogans serovar Grippotyphosa str. LT2186]EMJ46380.1 hypothetic